MPVNLHHKMKTVGQIAHVWIHGAQFPISWGTENSSKEFLRQVGDSRENAVSKIPAPFFRESLLTSSNVTGRFGARWWVLSFGPIKVTVMFEGTWEAYGHTVTVSVIVVRVFDAVD
jgi:hypothetical protein